MPNYICVTCGTQFAESPQPPAHCPICADERQYIGANGQEWTTLDALRADRKMVIEPQEPNLYRLTVFIGNQSLSRVYRLDEQMLAQAGAWVRKE